MMEGGRRFTWALGSMLWALSVASTHADIYRYVDEEGVWHFTNIKTDDRYELFMRTPRRHSRARPEAFNEIIEAAARRYGVDSRLIRALIKAESDFDPRAVSKKGAQGLMQLMPETAARLQVKDTFDPRENIHGGTRYFSQLLKRFNNDTALALAAYNAGPESVETHRGIPPIAETKAFVEKVLNYYRQYNNGRP